MSEENYITLALLVFGPTIGYVDQWFRMKRNKSAKGFSTLICGILLISNILRCFFWYFKRFDTTLLYQSCAMIVCQCSLLNTCLDYPSENKLKRMELKLQKDLQKEGISEEKSIKISKQESQNGTLNMRRKSSLTFDILDEPFWEWNDFTSYMTFLAAFMVTLFFILEIFNLSPIIFETYGLLGLLIESTLPLPQAINHYKSKSTNGFSPILLSVFVFGDFFKLFYFIFTLAPFQFFICAAIQLSIDYILLAQVYAYNPSINESIKNNVPIIAKKFDFTLTLFESLLKATTEKFKSSSFYEKINNLKQFLTSLKSENIMNKIKSSGDSLNEKITKGEKKLEAMMSGKDAPENEEKKTKFKSSMKAKKDMFTIPEMNRAKSEFIK